MTRVGCQLPETANIPLFHSSLGDDAVALAGIAGLMLDEWQQHVLKCSLNMTSAGKFAAKDMCVIVPRQQGKGSVIEARELAGLFLLPERTIMHSAHEFRTAQEGYQRLANLVNNSDFLVNEGKPKCTNSGAAGTVVKLTDRKYKDKRVVFSARSKGAGRGFTVDTVIFDEAYDLPEAALEAMSPMQTAVPNAQTWFLSSTGFDDSEVLRRQRARGLARDPEIGFFEFKADDDCDPADVDQWYKANPALGIRVTEEFLQGQFQKLSPIGFAREHLGLWTSLDIDALIPTGLWKSLEYTKGQLETRGDGPATTGEVSFAVDADPMGSVATVSFAGFTPDRLYHVETFATDEGINWVPAFIKQLDEKFKPKSIVIDPQGPISAIIPQLDELGVPYTAINARDVITACAQFLEFCIDNRLRHNPGDVPLANAVPMAVKREINKAGGWAWARKDMEANISPLVAATYALYGFTAKQAERKPGRRMW